MFAWIVLSGGAMSWVRGTVLPLAGDCADSKNRSMAFHISSGSFKDGGRMPEKHTVKGRDSSPPLSWRDPPEGTRGFALICDDPDAPRPEPWVHWVIWNIPPDARGLSEGIPKQVTVNLPKGAVQGTNSWPSDNVGYRGPAPPPRHGVHHYHFKLYALDVTLDLPPKTSKKELLKAMDEHILGQAELVGTFER